MLRKLIFSLVILICLTSCDGPPPNGTETPVAISTPQDIQVGVVEVTKSDHHTGEIELPNCEGSSEVTTNLGASASISQSIEVGTSFSLSTGLEVQIPATAKAALEVKVGATYNSQVESTQNLLYGIGMKAEPGTHIIYEVTWENHKYESDVTYSMGDDNLKAPYSFIMLAPKLSGSKSVPCPTEPQVQPTAPPTPEPGSAVHFLAFDYFGGLNDSVSTKDDLEDLWEMLSDNGKITLNDNDVDNYKDFWWERRVKFKLYDCSTTEVVVDLDFYDRGDTNYMTSLGKTTDLKFTLIQRSGKWLIDEVEDISDEGHQCEFVYEN
jgi:hypothetical protein